jgi:micrococcal nuclease
MGGGRRLNRDFCRNLLHCGAEFRVGHDLLLRQAVAGAVALSMMAGSAAACEGLRDGPKGTVTQIVDGDTLLLDTGLVVRLIGIQAPHLALGREGLSDWPGADVAKATLEALVLHRPVMLRFGGADKDRHGRTLAQVYVTDAGEGWVQENMLRAGMARVYTFPDNRACAAELYAAEGQARADRIGMWADPEYTVRSADRPDLLLPLVGHFELIEGRVLKAEKTGGRVFLNFGRLFKEDFTAVIDARALKLFAGDELDPLGLSGALVRVRGWIDSSGGPRITVTHPEQIEVLARP